MNEEREQILLRVYLQSADRAPHTPTYEGIVSAARHEKLAGATVLRGIMGYGPAGMLKQSVWSFVGHMPVVVEVVDTAPRIAKFLKGPMSHLAIGGTVTLERANVMMYRHKDAQRATLKLAVPIKPLMAASQMEVSDSMQIKEDGVLLRIFIGESDRQENMPLYEAIVHKARELGLAGATVLRGTEGFGANSVVHKASLVEMSTDLPVIIEIVDTQEKIAMLLPYLETVVGEGMITMEYVAIVLYRHNSNQSKAQT